MQWEGDAPEGSPATQPLDLEEGAEEGLSVCAVCLSDHQLGISHYDEVTNTLQMDWLECSNELLTDMLQCVKLTCRPTLFLVTPQFQSNPNYMEILTMGYDGARGVFPFRVMKSSQWSAEAAKAALAGKVRLPSDRLASDSTWKAHTRLIQLSSVVDFDCATLLKSLSVLLIYMQEHCFQLDEGMIPLSAIKQEFHPNVIKSKGRSKEGYSLFALFDRTKSALGRHALRSWMLRPFYNRDSIVHRQNGIEFTMHQDNRGYINDVSKLLRSVGNLPNSLLKIKKVSATYREWTLLHKTLGAILTISDLTAYFTESSINFEDKEYIEQIFSNNDIDSVRGIFNFLLAAIDFDLTEESKVVVIREGYDGALDEMRRVLDSLPVELNQAAHAILEQCPLLQNVTVEYIPQFGYMSAVDPAEAMFLDEQDFSFKYQDDKCYYKCAVVEALDDRIGDIKNSILDYQKQMMVVIEETVLDKETELIAVSYALGEIDALIALGEVALERQYVRPEIETQNVLVIKNGRHPLQEMTSLESFIANDTCILPDKNIALITGANGSGKTVYIKQVGLIVYMAHIGMLVPCDKAVIGLTDRIMTRIASTESVVSSQSSFTLDLNQISSMLNTHTDRSLCLIDEFGKGTSPVDGIALLSVTISHFAAHKAMAFFVLHFTEALDPEIFPSESMECVTLFNMACHESSDFDEKESLSMPLYKLKLGIGASSEGIPCARLAGIPTTVLDRAFEIKTAIQTRSFLNPLDDVRLKDIRDPLYRELLVTGLLTTDWKKASDETIVAFKSLIDSM